MASRTTHHGSRSRRPLARVRWVAVVVTAALVACSGGGEVASPFTGPATTPPGPELSTSTPVTDPSATVDTGSAVSSSPVPTVTAPEGVVTLSPDGPWRLVDSAPGVDTPGLVYELMPGLWAYLPVVEDVGAGITWVLNETDRPVIEAYLQARLVYFRSINQDPMDLDGPGWATWYLDAGAAYMTVLRPRAERGEHGDLDRGVVLRPVVLGDERSATSALVVSCTLDGGVILTADGELADGSSWGVVSTGSAYRMSLVDGSWRVAEYSSAEGVCAN